ncbi:hypothetical protein [Streptomyces sp. NPDC002671]
MTRSKAVPPTPRKTIRDLRALEFAALAEQQRHQMLPWMLKTLQDATEAHPLPAGQVLDPPAAGEYFGRVRQHIEARITAMTQSYPPIQWLWYLRRLPDLFDGRLPTTGPSDRALMGLMAATSTKTCPQLPVVKGEIAFPVTDGVVRRVLRLCAMTIVLSEVHSATRRAGKGISFRAAAQGLPQGIPDPDIEQAIELYDQRVAQGEDGLLASGTRVLSPDHNVGDPAPLITIAELPSWRELPAFRGPLKDNTWLRARGRFVPEQMSIAALPQILAQARPQEAWWRPAFPALLALLQALHWYMWEFTGVGGLSAIRYGYLTLPHRVLEEVLDDVLPVLRGQFETWFPGAAPSSARQVIADLEALPITLWPNEPGPVLHHAGDDVLVDFAAATRHLMQMCTIASPGGGPLPNARADHFEHAVQGLIDASAWKPGPGLERGMRPDPYGDGPITDLDAVGEKDGTLLVVSCKSIPYTAAYDAGEYGAVRNVSSTVDKAIDKWHEVVETLTTQPVGQNYDFSRFERIVGVVCIPHVPYTPIGRATETLLTTSAGHPLRRVNSYSELSRWLNAPN